MKLLDLRNTRHVFIWSLITISIFALLLSLIRVEITDSSRYLFLSWNLALAWIPLGFAWLLYSNTSKGLTWSWKNFGLFFGWLLFLPNAFYLLSDFIHLRRLTEIDMMFDIVLFSAYAWVGLALGLISLYLVHTRALQRFGPLGHWLPAAALLLCGYAIYLGRYLRWNSWDVILNPLGLLFDITDSFIHPTQHAAAFSTTILFFAFFGIQYAIIWLVASAVAVGKKSKS